MSPCAHSPARMVRITAVLLCLLGLAASRAGAEFAGSLESLCPSAPDGLTLMRQFSMRDDPAYDSEIRFYTDQQGTSMITLVIMAWKTDVAARQALSPGDLDRVLEWPPAAAPDMAAEYETVGGMDVAGWPVRAIRMSQPCEVLGFITARDNVHVTVTGGSLTCGAVDSDSMRAHARAIYEYILPRIPLPEGAAASPGSSGTPDSPGRDSGSRYEGDVGLAEVAAVLAAVVLLLGGGGLLLLRRTPKPRPVPPRAAPPPRPAPQPAPSPQHEPEAQSSPQGPSLDFAEPAPQPGPQTARGPRLDFGGPLVTGQGPQLQFEDQQPEQGRDRDEDRDQDREPRIMELTCSLGVIRDKGPLSAELSARVLSRDMTPLPGQQVEFSADHGAVAPALAATGPRGGAAKARWSAETRPQGDVRVWARHGQRPELTDFKIMRRESSEPAHLDARAMRTKLRADGKDGCDIRMAVADSQGRPLEGVALTAEVAQGRGALAWLAQGAATDQAGEAWARYTAPDAETLDQDPGRARIEVRCRDHPHVAGHAELEQEAERRAVRVEVAATPDALPPDGRSEARIAARLLDRRDRPVPRRPLEFFTEPTELAAHLTALRGVTDEAGEVRVGLRLPREMREPSATVVSRLEQGEEAPLEGSATIRVERFQLRAEADKDSLRADGRDQAVITARLERQDHGPVPGETVAAEWDGDAGRATLEPASAVTDNQGTAVFRCTAGRESGTIAAVLSVQGREGLSARVELKQEGEDCFDVELRHHHMGPVLRLVRRPEAAGRHKGLQAADIAELRVLANDRASSYGGAIPRDGWLLAALVMYCDCAPGSSYYAERAARYADLAQGLETAAQALEAMRSSHEARADQAEALRAIKLVYEAVTLLPGGAGRVFTASCMAMVSTLLGWGEDFLAAGDRVADLVRRGQWNALARDEAKLVRGIAVAARELSGHWADLGPDGGLEYKAEQVLPGAVDTAGNAVKNLLDGSAELMALQVDKARIVADLGGGDELLPENVLAAMEDLRALRRHRAEQWAEARAIRATAEALPSLRAAGSG